MDSNNPKNTRNLVWLGKLLWSGIHRKHYGGIRIGATEITVNSFVLVFINKHFHPVGYIEDLYENKKGSKKARVRWLHRYLEVKDLFPDLDINSEELFFSQSIKTIDVESIDCVATVLTPVHYSKFFELLDDGIKPLCLCGVFMCGKEIIDGDIKPFDLSQLFGYYNQSILSSLEDHSHEGPTNQSTDIPCGTPSTQFIKRVRSQRQKRQKIVHSVDSGSNSAQQIEISDTSCEMNENEVIQNEIIEDDIMPPKMKLKQLMRSFGNEHASVEVLSCENEFVEILNPRLPGRWFRCQILLKSPRLIKVKYHDNNAGELEEFLPAPGVATPDKLGMRWAGRMTVRPSPPQELSNNSFQLGDSVDIWLNKSWCEGVIISPGDISTPARFLVYLPDENKLESFDINDLRVSKDWVDKEWKEIPRKLDILSVMSTMLADAAATTAANP